jgi:hypothetical protein
LIIIALLLLVFADPGPKLACCRPATAPLVGTVLLALIFLYAGGHMLSSLPAFAPRASGVALASLAVGFLFLPRLGHRLLRGLPQRLLLWLIAHEETDDTPTLQTPRSLATPQPVAGLVLVRAQS